MLNRRAAKTRPLIFERLFFLNDVRLMPNSRKPLENLLKSFGTPFDLEVSTLVDSACGSRDVAERVNEI